MSDFNFKVGIIGCGNIARTHLPYILNNVKKEQIALCDRDQVRLKDFSEYSKIRAVYNDVSAMLDDFKPNVCHIITSPTTHKNLAVTCIEKGCHVLVEKPMCVTELEADEMIVAAKKNNMSICIDHTRVYDPFIMKFKRLFDAGVFGEILHISSTISDDVLKRIQKGLAVRWVNDLPGGIYFDLLPHPLSIFTVFLPDLNLESCRQQVGSASSITDISCHFSSDTGSASLHMSLNLYPLQHCYTFECEKGIVKVDLRNFLMSVSKQGNMPEIVYRVTGKVSEGIKLAYNGTGNIFKFITGRLDSYSGLNTIINKFYQSIQNGRESPVPAEQGRLIASLSNRIFPTIKNEHDSYSQYSTPLVKTKSDVLVTGGTGFIGQSLVNRLNEDGHSIRVLTHRSPNQSYGIFNGKVELVQGDIYNYDDVYRAMDGVKTVYHLAAATAGNWNYHLDITVTGTSNVIKASKAMGVERIVYTSTLSVLHACKYPAGKLIDEDFQFEANPEKRGYYSNAKLQAEAIVREEMNNGDLSIIILRPGLVYGLGKEIITPDVGRRFGNKFLLLFGFGRRRIPLNHVENLVDAFILAGNNERNLNGIYNVVDNNSPTQKQVIKYYKKNGGDSLFVIPIPRSLLLSGFWTLDKLLKFILKKDTNLLYKFRSSSRSVIHSTNRIKADLGWESMITWKEGLKTLLK